MLSSDSLSSGTHQLRACVTAMSNSKGVASIPKYKGFRFSKIITLNDNGVDGHGNIVKPTEKSLEVFQGIAVGDPDDDANELPDNFVEKDDDE